MTTTTNKLGRWAKIRQALPWKKIGRWLLLVVLTVALAATGFLLYTILAFGWPIESGFGPYTPPQPPIEGYQREKTAWDWLQLLIIPIVLAIGGFFLTRSENRYALKLQERRETEARKLETERAQDTALQSYLDQMTQLLLHEKLQTSQPDGEVRSVARARTLTVLRVLDGVRKATVLQFLYEARLIGGIELEEGGVSGTIKAKVSLKGADLIGADLIGADLIEAYLMRADLRFANLIRTRLFGTHLNWVDLTGANLAGADLTHANLAGAHLVGANLVGANLTQAELIRADLTEANLTQAKLIRADLAAANLTQANLIRADLTEANLSMCHVVFDNLIVDLPHSR